MNYDELLGLSVLCDAVTPQRCTIHVIFWYAMPKCYAYQKIYCATHI